jgi:hypothetical protein
VALLRTGWVVHCNMRYLHGAGLQRSLMARHKINARFVDEALETPALALPIVERRIACLRHSSTTGAPASCSFRIPMILYRDRFIRPSHCGLYLLLAGFRGALSIASVRACR